MSPRASLARRSVTLLAATALACLGIAGAARHAMAVGDVFQGRPLGFGVFANYQRLIQPAVVADPNLSFNRNDVNVGAEVVATPGGGTLDLRAGYQFFGAFFEEANGAPFTNLTHEVSMRNRF